MVVLTNTSIPSDTIKLTQSSVQVYAGQESLGNGTLYVSERTLAWVTNDNKGFELNYRSIILHAISTDLTNFAQEHIYVLVDNNKAEHRRRRAPVLLTQHEAQLHQDIQMANNELNGAGDEEDVEDDDSEAGQSIEFRLVPDNKDSLSEIYHEICVCQELNPEEDESFSEDEMDYEGEELSNGVNGGGNQWITAENMDSGNLQLSEEGMENLNRMLGQIHQSDCEEDDEEMQ